MKASLPLTAVLLLTTAAQGKLPDAVAISKAKAAVAAAMRDSSSVQFRDVKIERTCGVTEYVKGWANAKNGYGGYGGFMIFLVRLDGGAAAVMQGAGQAMATEAEFRTAAVCNGNAAE